MGRFGLRGLNFHCRAAFDFTRFDTCFRFVSAKIPCGPNGSWRMFCYNAEHLQGGFAPSLRAFHEFIGTGGFE